jgi:hypothetical protein
MGSEKFIAIIIIIISLYVHVFFSHLPRASLYLALGMLSEHGNKGFH